MATNTPNYNLIKPDGTDPVNIADLNNNADIIDTTLKNINDRVLPVATQAQAQTGTDNASLMTPLRVRNALSNVGLAVSSLTEVNSGSFNDLTIGGMYTTSSTLLNSPPETSNFNVLVMPRSNNFTVQIAVAISSGLIYSRVKRSANWSEWDVANKAIATQAQSQEGTNNTTVMTPLRVYENIASKSTTITDLDNLMRAGSYFIGSTAGIVNKPPNTSNNSAHIIVYNNINQSIPNQFYFSVNEGRYFIRSRIGYLATDAWHPWRELGRNISTSAQAKTGTDDSTVMSPSKVKESINNSPISRYGTATGTNALVITANPLFDDLYTGLTVKFKNTTANTGNVTINVNSKGVKSVLNNDGTQIKPGKLKANSLYEITYDGTNFYLTKGGGEESPISKVTRGSTTISSSSLSSQVTLPQFNVNKSVLKISVTTSSASVTGTSTATNVLARIVDNTTISFTRNATSINNLIVYWELIEYEDYVNVQKGISDLSTNSLTVPISTVNTDKSVIYFSYDSSTNGEYAQMTSGHLNSSSELLFRRGSDTGINKISWFVVEIS